MVGLEVAREVARELKPKRIVISALTKGEVDSAVSLLANESKENRWGVKFDGDASDIFVPESLQGRERAGLVDDPAAFDELFDDIFSPDPDAYKRSRLFNLLEQFRPDAVIDCINTATAISYQDSYTTSRRVKVMLDRFASGESFEGERRVDFVRSIRELLIAQGVPQITRHILFLHRALRDTGVSVYVKVGTTGTGGMGVNIPYTHSEERPSATLLSKSAIGFAHTGLLFLLARTPAGGGAGAESEPETMIKEVKPGAMIGFKRLGLTHVKINGASGRVPGFLIESKEEPLGEALDVRESFDHYSRFEGREMPFQIVGADTGENGFFSIGEFQAITYPRQMEYVTPEEVARTVVLEIMGSSTGRDVISAIDGAITEPSYRAGVLRHYACQEMERLERAFAGRDDVLPSIAVGHLGPPRLSKLLIESHLIRAAAGTSDLERLAALDAKTLREMVETYLAANPRIGSMTTTIGIAILRERDGRNVIARGPRLNIPVPRPDAQPVPLTPDSIEKFAFLGWVDLREKNFEVWKQRIEKLRTSRPDIVRDGSASFDSSSYLQDEFIPGDIVGWLLTTETDEMGMVGHRIL
jgi:hypothetical protein